MVNRLARAVARFLTLCPYTLSVHDLITKYRILLEGGYLFDLYFNETRNTYSYTLIQGCRRILGWDNAPHHPDLENYPHHFHRDDGTIVPSALAGVPEEDINLIAATLNKYLAQQL
jgi:hypothetical protein